MAQAGPVAKACDTYAGLHADIDLSFHILPLGLEADQYQAKMAMDKSETTMAASTFFVTNDKVSVCGLLSVVSTSHSRRQHSTPN
jgi:hypothetical protein